MPRKILIRTEEYPYHITNRSNNREFFYIESSDLWGIFIKCFWELKEQFNCEIHAFVLMTNHYHLIISTPDRNIGEAMKYLHREVARHANRKSKRINHFFGGRYKWSLVNDEAYFWNALKYVYRNPVRANLCENVEDYSFSSLSKKRTEFPWTVTDYFSTQKSSIDLDLNWLNEPFLGEIEEGIQKALRRREFKMPADRNRRGISIDKLHYKKGTVTY